MPPLPPGWDEAGDLELDPAVFIGLIDEPHGLRVDEHGCGGGAAETARMAGSAAMSGA